MAALWIPGYGDRRGGRRAAGAPDNAFSASGIFLPG